MSNATAPAAAHMDRIYRYQRHFYDATRHNFLLGRDTLIAGLLPPPDGGSVVEVGCGTARNLIQAAKAYPKARFYGFDISAVMLETARKNIAAAGLGDRISVIEGDATNFDLQQLFGLRGADRIFISYALSMIPPWRDVLARSATQLAPSGSLHVVDFGQSQGLPRAFKSVLYAWLAKFSVHPSNELESELRRVALKDDLDLSIAHPLRGYATYAVMRRK
ncbi:MAG: class I SAM-dependent methyltransferase [Hyphomicrobiaceae bacterium]